MVDVIKADDPNVLSQYHRHKVVFHFQQKSDNDFVMFLLDTAVRVISIVHQLTPVLEAVTNTQQTNSGIGNKESALGDLANSMYSTSRSSDITNRMYNPSAAGSVDDKLYKDVKMADITTPILFTTTELHDTVSRSTPVSGTSFVSIPETDIVLEAFDKTISQLQQELNSVSNSFSVSNTLPTILATDSNNTMITNNSNISNNNNVPNPAIDTTQENLSLIKSIQDNIQHASPDCKKQENLNIIRTIEENMQLNAHIKLSENNSLPMQSLNAVQHYSAPGVHSTERLQELMSTLNNTNLNSMSTSLHKATLAPSPLSNLADSPPPACLSPGIPPNQSSVKRATTNPLSMLHMPNTNNSNILHMPNTNNTNTNSTSSPGSYTDNSDIPDPGTILDVLYNNDPTLIKKEADNGDNDSPGRRRPFHCVHCLKNFSFKSSLDRHISVIHLGQRRYCCPICAAAFGQKKQLKHHMTTRHGDVLAQLQMIQTA